jgi:hypothetical protein
MAVGRYEKAGDPLERAYNSSLRGRSLTINRAILDLVQRVNVMHGIKELKVFLSKQPAPDEMAMNVLGACLGLASNDEHLFQTAFFQGVGEFYQTKNKELEASHPGQMRWGTQWLSPQEAKSQLDKEAEGLKKYKQSIESVRSFEQEVKAAQSARDGATSVPAVNAANARMANAKANLAASMAAQKDAWKNIHRPEWPKTFPPLLPEFAGGGVFGQPGTGEPKVAIGPATPLEKPPVIPNPDTNVTPPRPADPPLPDKPDKTDSASAETARSPKRLVSRSAVAVPVGPDLLLTAAAPLENASEFRLEASDTNVYSAELVRKDSVLALLRIKGQSMPYLNLATSFTGGEVTGWGYPEVSIFAPTPEAIPGSTQAPKGESWKVSLRRHPRLAGTAVLDKSGALVGISLGDRDSVMTQIPTATAEQIRAFLGTDAPNSVCSNPNPGGVMQLTASREAQ